MERLSEDTISADGIRHILPLCTIHTLLLVNTQITLYVTKFRVCFTYVCKQIGN